MTCTNGQISAFLLGVQVGKYNRKRQLGFIRLTYIGVHANFSYSFDE